MDGQICGVCRGSHMCGRPPRHDGDHGCLDDFDAGEPHETWSRNADHQYGFDLIVSNKEGFCELCGPVDSSRYANWLLDHLMQVHPDVWAAEYASQFTDYLGDGRWASSVA